MAQRASRVALSIYRVAHACLRWRVPFVPGLLKAINRIVFGLVLPPSAVIGRNVTLGYEGLGIVIHHRAVVGDNVNIGPGVTIGGRSEYHDVPVLEHDVLVGTGAKILGPVRIGHHARIGANAVVLSDVPPYATAVGVPARIVRIDAPDRVHKHEVVA